MIQLAGKQKFTAKHDIGVPFYLCKRQDKEKRQVQQQVLDTAPSRWGAASACHCAATKIGPIVLLTALTREKA